MNGRGNLVLDFVDASGKRPDDRVDVRLKHLELSHTAEARDKRTSSRLRFTDLVSTHGGIYEVHAFPMRYRPVGRFIRILEGKTVQQTIALPVDPARVREVIFPDYQALAADLQQALARSEVEGHAGLRGTDLWHALDEFRKAGLLNLYAKMKRTSFPNGRDAFSYIISLRRIRGDRFFARVEPELRDEVKNSIAAGLFRKVSGTLHTPPPDFTLDDSFKTKEAHGNLQITFFFKAQTLEFIADVDIDPAQGIKHIFQVIGHTVTGGETHPYDVHDILVRDQQIDPGYTLIV